MDDKTAIEVLRDLEANGDFARCTNEQAKEARQHAIQAIEALGRVRELIASLEAESVDFGAGKFIARELRNRIGDKP